MCLSYFPSVLVNSSPELLEELPISKEDIDGLVQDCSNSIADALELLHSCIRPSMYLFAGDSWQCGKDLYN